MRFGGKAYGILLLLVVILTIIGAWQYDARLDAQRQEAIAAQLAAAHCNPAAGELCPQAEDISMPAPTVLGIIALGIITAFYLIQSDATQRRILAELQVKRAQLSAEERRELVLGVLTPDERTIIEAVIAQPGISQATLRLRTDMSKAKLSMLLTELERRGLLKRVEDGKTNQVHLKREL